MVKTSHYIGLKKIIKSHFNSVGPFWPFIVEHIKVKSNLFENSMQEISQGILRKTIKIGLQINFKILGIGPAWPLHILETLRATTDMLPYSREEFFKEIQ
jgi:hypothetical protein